MVTKTRLDASDHRHLYELLKPLITHEWYEAQPDGGEPIKRCSYKEGAPDEAALADSLKPKVPKINATKLRYYRATSFGLLGGETMGKAGPVRPSKEKEDNDKLLERIDTLTTRVEELTAMVKTLL